MGFLDSLFRRLTTENAGVMLAEAGLRAAVGSTSALINLTADFAAIDKNTLGVLASSQFIFLNNHWINRQAREILSDPLRNEVFTFLLASQAVRIGSFIEKGAEDDQMVAMARVIQGQDSFDERFGSLSPAGDPQRGGLGGLFYEFAKQLTDAIGLDRDARFVAMTTGIALQGVDSLRARDVLRRVRRSNA